MSARRKRWSNSWAIALLLVLAAACTEAHLQPLPPPEVPPLDNYLQIDGEYCTEPSADVVFPLKVLYIIDQSASLQFTDPENLRFSALNQSLDQVRSLPNAEFAFIGFASWSRTATFTRNRDDIATFVDPSAGLGPATDYQGALATAVRMVEEDILAAGPAERARTRYVINFVSDGIPEPRCLPGCEDDQSNCSNGNDDDGDGSIDGADTDCANIGDNVLHPDNLYGVCNTEQEIPDDVYVDITGICPEYNMPAQIMGRVQELLSLQDIYSVGDVTLNTVFLFTEMPGVDVSQFGYERGQARNLLESMAEAGEGVFRDVNLGVDQSDFLNFDITSLKAELTLTRMLAYNTHATLTEEGLEVDTDSDGLSDRVETELRTDRSRADSDDDNYGDLFEDRLRDEGFEPSDATAPAVSCMDDRDGDGDSLTDCEEDFLGTDPTAPDTDGDGVLDWIELLVGTDPLEADGLADFDFDGVVNLDEILAGTNPIVPDADVFRNDRIVYDIDDKGVLDVEDPDNGSVEERHCYNYSVKRIPMVITPIPKQNGLNRILIFASEKAAKVAGLPGEVRVACFEAFYQGEQSKNPENGIIDVTPEGLADQRQRLADAVTQLTACPRFTGGVSRGAIEQLADECMPPRVQLGRKLYKQAELFDMMARSLDPGMNSTLPTLPHRLFVPMSAFDPAQHCFRPWELDLVIDFLAESETACIECSEAAP